MEMFVKQGYVAKLLKTVVTKQTTLLCYVFIIEQVIFRIGDTL